MFCCPLKPALSCSLELSWRSSLSSKLKVRPRLILASGGRPGQDWAACGFPSDSFRMPASNPSSRACGQGISVGLVRSVEAQPEDAWEGDAMESGLEWLFAVALNPGGHWCIRGAQQRRETRADCRDHQVFGQRS